ncbi:MAG: hypothetical protein WCV63_10940 [Negativicutes bacterium]|jgi:hypothetical protein
MLIGNFAEPVARAAFMTLVKESGTVYFPPPGKVFEQCKLLAKRVNAVRTLPYRGWERAKSEAWLQRVCEDDEYCRSHPDERTQALAKHFFPDITAASYEANFLTFDHLRLMYDSCACCTGHCSRGGYTGFPRLDANGASISVIMAKCGRAC